MSIDDHGLVGRQDMFQGRIEALRDRWWRSTRAGRCAGALALGLGGLYAAPVVDAATSAPAGSQQIAIPSYIHPGADPAAWDRLIGSDPGKVGIAVANVLNGPDIERKDEWASVMRRAHDAGIKVLGYVDTGYFGGTGMRTRLGSTRPEDWLSQAQQDINSWYELYGDDLGGIFFDDGQNACGPEDGSNRWADLQAQLNEFQKRRHPDSLTVLNPGTVVPQCFENTADVLLTFESPYDAYVGTNPNDALNYRELGWTPADPSRIWHLVYGASREQMLHAIDLSRERGAGYVYVTDDIPANPWDSVPEAGYWNDEQAAVSGGFVAPDPYPPLPFLNVSPPTAPEALTATSTDFTSTTLSWEPSNETDTGDAVSGYEILSGARAILTMPADISSVRVGGLMPGYDYLFTVRATDRSGNSSLPSAAVVVTTPTLSEAIASPEVNETDTTVTYGAAFFMPFSFRRVFIVTDNGQPCWWTGTVPQQCSEYLIENGALLHYSGGSEGSGWTWTKVRDLPGSYDGGYRYSWTLDKADLSSPGVQTVFNGEGYGPLSYLGVPTAVSVPEQEPTPASPFTELLRYLRQVTPATTLN